MSRCAYADPCLVCADDDRDCPRHTSWTLHHDLSRGPWWQAGVIAQGFLLGLFCNLAFVGAVTLGQHVVCAAHDDSLRYCAGYAEQVQR